MKTILVLMVCVVSSMSSWALNIDNKAITISGISSGAYMTGQLQMIHSSQFSGAAMMAGGIFNCANGEALKAVKSCMGVSEKTPTLEELLNSVNEFQNQGKIDSVSGLKKNRIYLLAGKTDSVVLPELTYLNREFLIQLGVSENNIKVNDQLQLGHAVPTLDFGNECEVPGKSPFISKCDFDGAGDILKFLYPEISGSRGEQIPDNFFSISQKNEALTDPASISMDETAYVYVPKACQRGALCRLHVAFHGCSQSPTDIGDTFYTKSGYNEWAETNKLVILYPQAKPAPKMGNPFGCWDWYGYTGKDYATKEGQQIKALMNLIERTKDFRP